jgi:hypothetical protein
MPGDSDPLINSRRCPDDFTSIILDMLMNVQYKLFGLMFIIFILLNTDVFITRVLATIQGAVDGKTATSWGTMIQGIILVIICIIVDAAIRQKII